MIADRNKFNFVTICIGLCILLTSASFASAQATSNTQQASDNQQQQQQTQKQAVIATISVVDNKAKVEETNAIINESANEVVHAFSPRLDYSNEWRPVGRGDPLKNDPTFDYSPPTLEHVRYWAETTKDSNSKEELGSASKQDSSSNINYARPNKQNNLLLAKPSEHLRSAAHQHHSHPNQYAMSHQAYAMKNAKGETPLLQPKYQSVRRSYYAQQLPTRLMPPPMQMNSPPINTFNVPMKPSPATQMNVEYRHSMAGSSGAAVLPSMGSQTSNGSHMKSQHYGSMSTPSSMSWMYNSPSAMQHAQQPQQQHHHYVMSSSGSSPVSPKSTTQQTSRKPLTHSPYDSYSQDTHHYVSYMRPSVNSMSSHAPHESYSPNSLRQGVSNVKQNVVSGRKPWLQELLRKEVVKTSAKPSYTTTSSNKFVYETTKPIYETTKPFYERMPSTNSIGSGFTPYTPVTHVPAPPTIATTTTTTHASQTPFVPLSSTSTYRPVMSTTLIAYTTSTTKHAIYTTPPTTTTTTTTPRSTSSTTSSRLLIPTTSNLVSRPTVAPMQMTTDSLFSHYKQPEAPIRGPMYLIIEGHSKVKKYGKNGINLNLPKIVPVVPKREPVVRVAEPGEEKRGTPETFQVEHLHVKSTTTTPKTTTTTRHSMTTAKPESTTTAKARTSATTAKPKTSAPTAKPTTTAKPAVITKLEALSNNTKVTLKPSLPSTTTTTTRPAATIATPKINSTAAANKETMQATAADNAAKPLTTTAKPTYDEPLLKFELPNEPPTGMQGLLSLLDSSLGSLFAEQRLDLTEMPAQHLTQPQPASTSQLTTPSTILQALSTSTPLHSSAQSQTVLVPVAANARIGTNANRILAVAADADGSAEFSYTTDIPPREVRQVFDYDQRPESRLKDFAIKSAADGVPPAVVAASDEGASAFYEDEFEEEYEDENDDVFGAANGNQQPIKRMDQLIYGDEGEFVGDYEDVKLAEFGMNMGDVRMQAKMA